MKKKILNLFVFLILLAVAFYLYWTQKGSTFKKELSDFAVEDTASISKVFLADKEGKNITLKRLENGTWELNGKFVAREDAVENMLTTIKRVKVKAPVSKIAFENVVKQIAGKLVKVEIYQGGERPSKVYYVGGPNQEHNGTYMLMENSSVPFLTHIEGFYGYLTPRYFTDENAWKNTAIFSYQFNEIASVKVEYPQEQEKSFMITVKDATHFDVQPFVSSITMNGFDTLRVKDYVRRYKKIHFEGFEETKTQTFIDSVIQTVPMRIFTVTDNKGKIKEVKAFLKSLPNGETLEEEPVAFDQERFYGLIDNTDFVVLQYFIFDPLTWTLDNFRIRKENNKS